jgi:DNA-binding transcriptional MerR regulator
VASTDRAPLTAPISPLLTTADLQFLFQRSDRTIRSWVGRGLLVPVKVGRSVYFRRDDVERLLTSEQP